MVFPYLSVCIYTIVVEVGIVSNGSFVYAFMSSFLCHITCLMLYRPEGSIWGIRG